jgi:hypothetical protein
MKRNYSTNEILKIANKFENLSKFYSIKKYAWAAAAAAVAFVIPLLGTAIREQVMSAESLEEAANNVLEAIKDVEDTVSESSFKAYFPGVVQSITGIGALTGIPQIAAIYEVRAHYGEHKDTIDKFKKDLNNFIKISNNLIKIINFDEKLKIITEEDYKKMVNSLTEYDKSSRGIGIGISEVSLAMEKMKNLGTRLGDTLGAFTIGLSSDLKDVQDRLNIFSMHMTEAASNAEKIRNLLEENQEKIMKEIQKRQQSNLPVASSKVPKSNLTQSVKNTESEDFENEDLINENSSGIGAGVSDWG